MHLLEDAIAYAARCHRGQVDKAGQPYILHPIRVMLRVRTEAERIVGVLHDVVEDTEATMEDLKRMGLPDEILEAIDLVTRHRDESYEEFIDRLKSNSLARRVKLADLEDNLDLSRLPDPSASDLARLEKYKRVREELKALEAPGGV